MHTMRSHVGSYILSHSKRLMNEVMNQIGGFINNSIYYGDTDKMYIPEKYRSVFVDIWIRS